MPEKHGSDDATMSWEPPIRPSWERRFQRAFPWVVAALGFAVIAPALRSGWVGDDAFYSVLNGVLGADRVPLLAAMRHAFDVWFFGNGRFYPVLILEKYLVFALFTNLIAYKALLVAATLATVELFRRCTAAYTNRGFGNLCALIAVALLALRGYQDAILAYNAMPQLVAILVLISVIAFRRALQRSDAREEAYAFSLLYAALAACVRRSPRAAMRFGAPYVAVAAVLVLVSVAARSRAGVPARLRIARCRTRPNRCVRRRSDRNARHFARSSTVSRAREVPARTAGRPRLHGR